MRVGLITDTSSIERGTGIARYSQKLLAGLSELGLDVQALCFSPPNIPLGSVINHVLKMPFLLAREADSFDLIHAIHPICALGFPLIHKPKKIVTYHDLTSLLCRNTNSAYHTRLFAPLFLRIGKFADRIIVDSSQTREEVITYLGISGHKITVVNLGVDEKLTPVGKENKDHYVIGYVGALSKRKGLDYLLRAFRLLKDKYPETPVRLVVCGSKGLEYPTLVKLAADLHVSDDVEFRGFVAEEALAKTYNSFDVFVLPSEWEGFGLPILEAQRCGVPVIARAGAHIPHEVTVACLKARTEEDMADKIYRLLIEPELRSTIAEKGLEYSRQFTWRDTAKSTLKVYEEALGAEGYC